MRHCGTPLGFWIPDGPSSGRIVAGTVPGKPTYNAETAAACLAACGTRRGTAIDGGAYVGTFSACIIGHFQRVIAFEPLFTNFECGELNVPKAEWHNAALSGHTGTVEVGQPVNGDKTYQWRVGEPVNTKQVRSVAIDDLGLTDLHLLKLDVEGHEFDVLNGALKTIKACRPVILIEEKLDPLKRAAGMLGEMGMKLRKQWKNDMLFVWS